MDLCELKWFGVPSGSRHLNESPRPNGTGTLALARPDESVSADGYGVDASPD